MTPFLEDVLSRVFMLSTRDEEKLFGMVITWLVPASLKRTDPKILMVVSKYNSTLPILLEERRFTLNLLSEDQIEEFFIFGARHSRDEDKFSHFKHDLTPGGVELAGVSAAADGHIDHHFETPDRVILYCTLENERKYGNSPMRLQNALQALNQQQKELLTRKMQEDTLRDEGLFTSS